MGSSAPKSFKHGTSTLVNKLAEGIDVRCNHAVQNVRHDGKRAYVTVEHEGTVVEDEADICVVTTQGPITAKIYPSGLRPEQHEFIATRRYERVTVASFCTSEAPRAMWSRSRCRRRRTSTLA